MAHVLIEINGHRWFDAEVEDYNTPPELPQSPARVHTKDLPKQVREVMAKAMAKALEQTLPGFRVKVDAEGGK